MLTSSCVGGTFTERNRYTLSDQRPCMLQEKTSARKAGRMFTVGTLSVRLQTRVTGWISNRGGAVQRPPASRPSRGGYGVIQRQANSRPVVQRSSHATSGGQRPVAEWLLDRCGTMQRQTNTRLVSQRSSHTTPGALAHTRHRGP